METAPVNKDFPQIDDFRSIVVENRPLIDTRAPIEFEKGSFPNTVNLPLMNNEEREAIGTTYKQKGHDAAMELGYKLVSGEIRQKKIDSWVKYIKKHPESYIFCWRGGNRSKITQEWIYEASGIIVPRLKGGYKAFRNYLIDESLNIVKSKEILIIGGRTGSGKTLLIEKIDSAIDLEGLANHRGSAFGRYAKEQPTQINFENALAYELIKKDAKEFNSIVIEDESRNIGQRYIPPEIFDEFQKGKVILLEIPLEERIEITYNDYIIFSQKDYDEAYKNGISEYNWIDTMRHNFKRIKKRLGDERYKKFSQMLESAWEEQKRTGDPSSHKEWIKALFTEYYDPMYDWQIDKKRDRVIFQGNQEEILDFIKKRTNSNNY